MSLSAALNIASRSLDVFSLGIQVAGNNIANAATPGYIRDNLVTESAAPYSVGNVVVGSGAVVTGVQQQLDQYLEQRIHGASTDYSASNVRQQTWVQLQNALQTLGPKDLSTSLNSFLSSLQTVVNQPDDPSLRTQAIQQGAQFATDAQNLRLQVDGLRTNASNQMKSLVDEANSLIQSIAQLNPQITKLEAGGAGHSDAGALRIQQLNDLQRLSEIIPLRVIQNPSGGVDLFTGNEYLLLGNNSQQLQAITQPSPAGVEIVNVQLSQTQAVLSPGGGELGGLIESRDKILGGFENQLDQLVGGVINEVNKIHSGGEGLIGYTSVTAADAVTDTNAPLNAAGLHFTPTNGSFQLKVVNQDTGAVTQTNVPVNLDGIGSDTSLEDLRAALGSVAHVTATITTDGRLKLAADNGYQLKFGDDTSGVLASLGINTFFTGHDSSDIAVQTNLLQDQRYLATGQGGGPADNTNVVALSKFLDNPLASLGGQSINDFHTSVVGSVAQSGAAEKALANGSQSFRDSLQAQRQQKSGVSLDEEAINVMQLQRNYQASAKVISTIDQLLNTLLNM